MDYTLYKAINGLSGSAFTHYPGDVVGGAVLGIAVAAALYLLAPTRRLIEAVARRCGGIWDRLLRRLAPTRAA